MRAIERCLDHPVQLKVRLQCRFVDVMQGLAAFLSVVAPVPRHEGAVVPVVGQHGLHRCLIFKRGGPGRCPDLHQQITYLVRGSGHFRFQLESGKVFIA